MTRIPTYLNPEQRHAFTQIPPDLSERDIARYYTFTEKERELINCRRRAPSNRLGFAVQLGLLKFPGRTLMEVKDVPRSVLTAIAEQVDVPASAFASYGERENTLYEHLDELRRECGFRACGWREYLLVARPLLADELTEHFFNRLMMFSDLRNCFLIFIININIGNLIGIQEIILWAAPTLNHGFYVLAESWFRVGAAQADRQLLTHHTRRRDIHERECHLFQVGNR